jgi:hypothetical protein
MRLKEAGPRVTWPELCRNVKFPALNETAERITHPALNGTAKRITQAN